MILPSIIALSVASSLTAPTLLPAPIQVETPSSPHSDREHLEYRVAFDLGSGKLKMLAAWVDVKKGRVAEIVKVAEVLIPLRDAINADPHQHIPEKIVDELKRGLRKLMQEAAAHGPVAGYAGTATEAFRVATNGMEVLRNIEKDLGISLTRLSAEEEGMLGYQALEAEGQLIEGMHPITWETGGGSMQILTKGQDGFQFYNLPLGQAVIKSYILKELRGIKITKAGMSPNPISMQEATQVIAWIKSQLEGAPSWVKEGLSQDNVEVIGRGAGFPKVYSGLGKTEYTKDELWELITQRLGKHDEEMSEVDAAFISKEPSEAIHMVSDLLFLYGVMDGLGFERIRYARMKGPGSTSALLVDEQRWAPSPNKRLARILGHIRA